MLTYRHWIAPELAYGRRLQQRLHGSTKRGYYSINVCFGTPSHAFELVVDTGSFMTAVPCINCKTCGEHTHARRFNANASSTARDCHKNTSRTHNSCGSYRMQYVEGSTISTEVAVIFTRLSEEARCTTTSIIAGVGFFAPLSASGSISRLPRNSEMRRKDTFAFRNWMTMMNRNERGKRSNVKSARLVITW